MVLGGHVGSRCDIQMTASEVILLMLKASILPEFPDPISFLVGYNKWITVHRGKIISAVEPWGEKRSGAWQPMENPSSNPLTDQGEKYEPRS